MSATPEVGCPRCRFTVTFRPADEDAPVRPVPVVFCKHGPVELLAALDADAEAAARADGAA